MRPSFIAINRIFPIKFTLFILVQIMVLLNFINILADFNQLRTIVAANIHKFLIIYKRISALISDG